jgi:gluconate 2-dehydrogenase subunit 3-like protein
MTRISRRTALELLTAAPAAAALTWTPAQAEQAHTHAAGARAQAASTATRFKPKFFTAHEYATVAVLVDLIIPRDDRSGSATEAGVPEFMDFMMIDQPRRQVAMRGGLAVIDRLSRDRFGKSFVQSTDAERRQLLDEIAYTAPDANAAKAPAARIPQAMAFFASFRDLTATGFFTSKMGIADLQYRGNVFVSEWNGCPEEALRKLGV